MQASGGGRGGTRPYAVEREVEDVEALVDAAGDRAFLFRTSSGAALALEAAIGLWDKVMALAMYEPAYRSDQEDTDEWRDYTRRLAQLLVEDRRWDARRWSRGRARWPRSRAKP